MAKELVTVRFLDSNEYSFTATKSGRRGANDTKELLRQLTNSRLVAVLMEEPSDNQSGYTITMHDVPWASKPALVLGVKRCFAKAGYKLKSPPAGRRQ
jgi:hypothetical protein